MVDVRPFRGLRFDPQRIGDLSRVVCPPYDVISPAERRELLALSPYNIVRVELPADQTPEAYDEAARTLAQWRAEGVLTTETVACFYLYEVRFPSEGRTAVRRSLVAAVRLDPWEAGQVLPHERTLAGPKEDRLRLLRATRANISPVWLLHHGGIEPLAVAWAWAEQHAPLAAFALADGTEHRLWALADPELTAAIQAAFSEQRLVVADGHHRYETALRYRDELAAAGPLDADHPAQFVMAHLSPEDDPGLVVFPTHRLVRDLGALDQAELEVELGADWHAEYFDVRSDTPAEQIRALLELLRARGAARPAIGLYGPDPTIFAILTPRDERLLEVRAPDRSPAWRALDVALLDVGLLEPLLAQRGAERERAVAYERDPLAAVRAVREGAYQMALFLNPTRPEQVVAVAEAGDRMPEKSTYFYPKPPTGLVIRDVV